MIEVEMDQMGSNLANIPPKTNMAMEHPPCEDVCPIENGDFPLP